MSRKLFVNIAVEDLDRSIAYALSAESREAVDEFADTALANGGAPAGDPQDQGFMYSRSFADPDGHHFEVFWMDPQALEQAPEAMAEAGAA